MKLNIREIKPFATILWVALVSFAAVDAARILAVQGAHASSHFWFHEAILKGLVAAGHQVTFIAPGSPLSEPVENFTVIDPRPDKSTVSPFEIRELKHVPWPLVYLFIYEVLEQACYNFMKSKEVQNILKSKEFDVMFVEAVPMFQCYLPIADKFDIPIIGMLPIRSYVLADQLVGNPRNPVTTPVELSSQPTRMSFFQRFKNVIDTTIVHLIDYYMQRNRVEKFYSQYFPKFDSKNTRKAALTFNNNHPSLFPRPHVPNSIDIGGIHSKFNKAKPIPEKIKTFMEEAEHGVIVFAMGSLVRSQSIGLELRTLLRDTFAQIPQRVIWKFDDVIDGLSDNVLLSNWIPQKEILAHPNVRVFISHCGMASVYEAIDTSTPLILMPISFDQITNAGALNQLGVGVYVDIMTLTKETFLNAINAVVNDTKYRDRMQELSRAFHDNPLPVDKTVVYWTEYVLRHKGTPHLRTSGADMHLYQYLLLDVIAFLITIAGGLLIAMPRIYKFVCGKRKTKMYNVKKIN